MREVDLWVWGLEVTAPELRAARDILSVDEIARADRYVKSSDQDHYIACRARLRQILATETGVDARDIEFYLGKNGKPSVAGGPEFNLSHSAGLAALAVCQDTAIGLDIEFVRPINKDVARRYFSVAEVAALSQVSGQKWLDGFYRCWTRKEAVIKAKGLGLSMRLDSFDVSLSENNPVHVERFDGEDPTAWRLVHFDPAPGWAGAVAQRTSGDELSLNSRFWSQ